MLEILFYYVGIKIILPVSLAGLTCGADLTSRQNRRPDGGYKIWNSSCFLIF